MHVYAFVLKQGVFKLFGTRSTSYTKVFKWKLRHPYGALEQNPNRNTRLHCIYPPPKQVALGLPHHLTSTR